LIFSSVGLLMYVASTAQSSDSSTVLLQSALTVVLLLALALWLAFSPAPLIPRSIFRNRTVIIGFLSAFGLYFSISLLRFMLPWYLQKAMLYTQSQTGLAMVVQPIFMFLSGMVAGRSTNILGATRQTALSLIGFILCVVGLSLSYGEIGLMLPVIAAMAAFQIFFSNANAKNMVDAVSPSEVGICTALNSMARSTSLPLGTVSCVALVHGLSPSHGLHQATQISTASFCLPLLVALVLTLKRPVLPSSPVLSPAGESTPPTLDTSMEEPDGKGYASLHGGAPPVLNLDVEQQGIMEEGLEEESDDGTASRAHKAQDSHAVAAAMPGYSGTNSKGV